MDRCGAKRPHSALYVRYPTLTTISRAVWWRTHTTSQCVVTNRTNVSGRTQKCCLEKHKIYTSTNIVLVINTRVCRLSYWFQTWPPTRKTSKKQQKRTITSQRLRNRFWRQKTQLDEKQSISRRQTQQKTAWQRQGPSHVLKAVKNKTTTGMKKNVRTCYLRAHL